MKVPAVSQSVQCPVTDSLLQLSSEDTLTPHLYPLSASLQTSELKHPGGRTGKVIGERRRCENIRYDGEISAMATAADNRYIV